MSPKNKRAIIFFLVLVVAIAIVTEGYRAIDRRASDREAQRFRSEATSATSAATTPIDAELWLEANGFRVLDWDRYGQHQVIGTLEIPGHEIIRFVEGERELHPGNWVLKPAWIHVRFLFDRGLTMHEIDASVSEMQDIFH